MKMTIIEYTMNFVIKGIKRDNIPVKDRSGLPYFTNQMEIYEGSGYIEARSMDEAHTIAFNTVTEMTKCKKMVEEYPHITIEIDLVDIYIGSNNIGENRRISYTNQSL